MAHAAMLKEDGGWSAEELSRMRSPGSGALSEQDGRSFMALLDMCHLLVDRITQEHNFADVNEAGSLRATDTRASAKLTASMYTYWDSAPAGPGVLGGSASSLASSPPSRSFRLSLKYSLGWLTPCMRGEPWVASKQLPHASW